MHKSKIRQRITLALESAEIEPTISTEGFLGKLKDWLFSKDEKKSKSDITNGKWVTDNTDGSSLNDGLELTVNELEVKLPENLLLDTKLTGVITVKELANHLKSNLSKYDPAKVRGYKTSQDANRIKDSLSGDIDDIEDWDVFKDTVLKYKGKLPAPYELPDDPTIAKLGERMSLTVKVDDISQINDLMKVASELWLHFWRLSDSSSHEGGLDYSDPPIRGFTDELEDDSEIFGILKHYLHPTFEDRYPNPTDEMVDRLDKIYNLIIDLIRRFVK